MALSSEERDKTLEELLEILRRMPEPTPWQKEQAALSFAYGNLAMTTNHRPTRKGFNALALKRGWTQLQFNEWAKDKEWRDEVKEMATD